MSRSIEYRDIHALAKVKGGKCLSDKYCGSKSYYEWECAIGHRWRAKYNAVSQRTWCPHCAKKAPHNTSWLQQLASKHSGRCLSSEYCGVFETYLWECLKGHRWNRSAHATRKGYWCSVCAGFDHDALWLQSLAQARGGRCVSTEYLGNHTRYLWECSRGHRWKARAGYINEGRWCTRCSGVRHDLEWLRDLASKQNGKCLSNSYKSCADNYSWECSSGHRWEATGSSAADGHWCPRCSKRHSTPELEIYEYVKARFPDTVSGKRGLLVSYRLELDVWIPSLNSAIEFDGTYWHKDPVAKRRDAKKNKQCKAAGIALMRVPEIEFARNKKTVFDAIDVFLTNCASSALSAPKTKISVLDNRAVAC